VSRPPTAHDHVSASGEGTPEALDHDEFSRLVTETQPALASLARRVARNDEDASDIVQEAYLRAWRARAGFRRDAEPTTWLWAIVRNTAYSHVSRRRGWDSLDDHEHVAGSVAGGEPEAATEHAALRTELLAAVGRLSPRLRAVVVLKELHGLAHDEVARRLGISVPAAKVRLHRARRRLHEVLRESHSRRPRTASAPVAAAT
jgi:RNA polymerase sigma-70 factor (ECF subfamily)